MDTFGDITTCGHDDDTVIETKARASRRCRSPIPVAIVGAVLISVSVATYQRLGTVANANVVETTKNLAGGFLALGMTESQPGFILVSALDPKDVSLDAHRSINKLAGAHTKVYIETGTQTWNARLRKPLVITIDDNGTIRSSTVDWPLHTFHLIRDAVDCSDQGSLQRKRCGTPFVDLKERVEKWPRNTVPKCLSEFLASR